MKKGFSLIELIVAMIIFLILFSFSYTIYSKYLNKVILDKMTVELVINFKKYQKFSYINKKRIKIRVDLESRKIIIDNNLINLSNRFNYSSNNKVDKLIFYREFTEKGNINKGFSINIYKDKKLIRSIVFNTINALSYPKIEVRDYV